MTQVYGVVGSHADQTSAETKSIQAVALRKLRLLNNARRIDDLRVPPANWLEALKGDRRGRYSIRINDHWRICFRWNEGHAYEVEIVDYH